MKWLCLADGIPHFICKQGKTVRLPLCCNSVNALCVIALCDAAVWFCAYPPFPNLGLTLLVFLPMYIVSCVIHVGLPDTGVLCESHPQWLHFRRDFPGVWRHTAFLCIRPFNGM